MSKYTADKKKGRPLIYENKQEDAMSKYSVRLTAWHARYARGKGKGSLSEGIRSIIEHWIKNKE